MSNSTLMTPRLDRRMAQVDGLRCLAIAAVAWSHWSPDSWQFGLPWGSGVQLFFVISGFLITGILLDNRRENVLLSVWTRFYARRALRIFPPFYLLIAIGVLLNIPPIRATWPWHVSYLSNFHFARAGNWVVPGNHFSHFWSLAVEEQFYLVWPFLVLLVSLARVERILWALLVLAPLSRIVSSHFFETNMVHVLTWSNLDSLGIGGLFACLVRSADPEDSRANKLARFCLWAGLPAGILGGVLAYKWKIPFALYTICHTGLVLFYGWLVFGAAKGFKGVLGAVLANKLVVYLGGISYGLYLYHKFAPLVVGYLGARIGLAGELANFRILGLVLDVLVTVALAILSWHCFEKPLNDLKRFFPYIPREAVRPVLAAVPAQSQAGTVSNE